MNEIKVTVNFKRRKIITTGVDLTSGDYNSTKLVFDFDTEEGTKIFEMNNPNGVLIYTKEIINNEVPLYVLDENEQKSSLFNQAGEYQFEVSLYNENSKLTSATSSLNVQPETVIIGNEEVETYLPVFDDLMNDIETAITKTNNLDLNATKVGSTATVSITNKEGITKSVEIYDGDAGADAKINGVNSLTIEAGDNITLDQQGSTLTINSTGGGGGTSNYNNLTNKPSINNITLSGNKTLSDLGLQPAGNYALESEIPTKTSDLTNDSGFITGYTETDPTVPNHVKNITQENITSWNNKSDFSGNYNDLTNKPVIPNEVTESTVSGWGFTKNTGTYSKPSGGIPKTDLASAVQTSLGKADTALQSISSSDVTSALGYTPYNSTNPNGYTSNVGTITGITMNGSSKGTSGIVDLGTVLTEHQDISTKLDISKLYNDYYFSMPKTIYAKLNTEIKMYFNNITTSNYLLKWGQYTNSTTIENYDDYISVLPTTKATKNISYSVYDRFLNHIENGTTNFVINNVAPNSQTMLIFGDSFVSQNYIAPYLRNLFSEDGKTLTLIGTKGSGNDKNEGYAGWKYTDFVSGERASTSAFWDGSKFNFSYYMQQNGYSTLDSVYIQLGTNDATPSYPNQDLSSTIQAARQIINSILEYNSNIKIYLGLTVMPSLNIKNFASKYDGTGFDWAKRANMQKLNKLIIDEFSNNNSIKIVANNLILDSTTDIRDDVHPTAEGYKKIANQVYYTMMS